MVKERNDDLRKQVEFGPALEVELRAKYHEWYDAELARYFGDSTPKGKAMQHRLEYLGREIFSKYLVPGDETGAKERKSAAIQKLKQMEHRNHCTNVRLRSLIALFPHRNGDITSQQIESVARKTIARVLGSSPDWSALSGAFTSGSSTSVDRDPRAVAQKFTEAADATVEGYEVFQRLFGELPSFQRYRCDLRFACAVTPGGILFTVPKTSAIDRCAVKEPDLNMFCQKAFGGFIRQRLRKVLKIDLNDQTRNQKLALVGSETGKLATLDLSSASDLISIELVKLLLPVEWFEALNAVRSRKIEIQGEEHETNMFSSMGNAFTFELESLIFYALVNAVCYLTGTRGTISVYGDDIICPSSVAGFVSRIFSFYGFIVNKRKSHWKGPFRESCGKHYYAGVDVTPFYVRKPIRDQARLIHFFNRFRQWSCRVSDPSDASWTFWSWGKSKVDKRFRGGRDCERIDALVSDDKPRLRLIRPRKEEKAPQVGAYLQWLCAADRRTGPLYFGIDNGPRAYTILSIGGRLTIREHLGTDKELKDLFDAPLKTSTVERELEGEWKVLRNEADRHAVFPRFPEEWC